MSVTGASFNINSINNLSEIELNHGLIGESSWHNQVIIKKNDFFLMFCILIFCFFFLLADSIKIVAIFLLEVFSMELMKEIWQLYFRNGGK